MQEKSRNLSGQLGEESMIRDKKCCINGCMVKSNLVISLVPYKEPSTAEMMMTAALCPE
jgi:hypothetical protein